MAFPGFDCGSFPGLDTLAAWMGTSPYVWVGYYLPSPCHSTTAFRPWLGNRAAIQALGYGLAVVYVGRFQGGCGQNSLSSTQGMLDGASAATSCSHDGFPSGARIFLDIEHFNAPMQQPMVDYVRGWVHAVAGNSPFSVGIYVHHANFAEVSAAVEAEYTDLGRAGDSPKYWILHGVKKFDVTTTSPTDLGDMAANVLQGGLDVGSRTFGGKTIGNIDEDVADTADPSAP